MSCTQAPQETHVACLETYSKTIGVPSDPRSLELGNCKQRSRVRGLTDLLEMLIGLSDQHRKKERMRPGEPLQ